MPKSADGTVRLIRGDHTLAEGFLVKPRLNLARDIPAAADRLREAVLMARRRSTRGASPSDGQAAGAAPSGPAPKPAHATVRSLQVLYTVTAGPLLALAVIKGPGVLSLPDVAVAPLAVALVTVLRTVSDYWLCWEFCLPSS